MFQPPQFDYGNFNRLLVALGTLAILGALVIPYVMLRETGALLVTRSQLTQLTPVARRAVLERQNVLAELPNYWFIPLVLIVLGLILIMTGAYRLYGRQHHEDTREELEVRRLTGLLEQSKPEVDAQTYVQAGVLLDAPDEAPAVAGRGATPPRLSQGELADEITSAEEAVIKRLAELFAPSAEVASHLKLSPGSEYTIDALITAKSTSTSILVKVELLTVVNSGLIREAVRQMGELQARFRSQFSERTTTGMLVFVLSTDADTIVRRDVVHNRAIDFQTQLHVTNLSIEVTGVGGISTWRPALLDLAASAP